LSNLFGAIGGGAGGGVDRPTPTLEPGEPTATVEQGVAVPDLTGYTDIAAEQTLRQLQLVPVRQDRNDPLVEFSTVISQAVPPGQLLPPGQPVTYTVSLGPVLVAVPNLTGVDASLARRQLAAAGLPLEELEEPSQTITAGFVIRQSPSAGLRIPQGQVVQIVVSQGDVVRFPDVLELQREAAERIVRGTPGLDLVFIDEQGRDKLGADYDRYAVGQVVSAQIENGRGLNNGDLVPRGSRVVLGVKRAE